MQDACLNIGLDKGDTVDSTFPQIECLLFCAGDLCTCHSSRDYGECCCFPRARLRGCSAGGLGLRSCECCIRRVAAAGLRGGVDSRREPDAAAGADAHEVGTTEATGQSGWPEAKVSNCAPSFPFLIPLAKNPVSYRKERLNRGHRHSGWQGTCINQRGNFVPLARETQTRACLA